MWKKKFWADLAERALASAAGAVLAAVGVEQTTPNVLTLDYKTLGGLAAGAAAFSVVKAFAKLFGQQVAAKSADRALAREVEQFLAKDSDAR